jgi:hypothetical protein
MTTNQEAYEKLTKERPVIVKRLERLIRDYPSANLAAVTVISLDDPPELRELIHQAARYILHDPAPYQEEGNQ